MTHPGIRGILQPEFQIPNHLSQGGLDISPLTITFMSFYPSIISAISAKQCGHRCLVLSCCTSLNCKAVVEVMNSRPTPCNFII